MISHVELSDVQSGEATTPAWCRRLKGVPQTAGRKDNLFEVRGVHVPEGLGGDAVVGQDGQVVLSRQLAQQVDQLLLHARLLQRSGAGQGK